MGRLLISTLGVNDYVACNYLFGNNKIENMRFIQEAVIRNYCPDWDKHKNDRIFILCTEDAKKKNWFNDGHKQNEQNVPVIGLRDRISTLLKESEFSKINSDPDAMVAPIVEGNSEKQIWNIFQTIFELIADGDEIYFDITHAFRSLPMLALVVLQYAKQLRNNITIKVISYGAFETLGPVNKVKELPLSERNAPVFDLTGFVQLMDWTNAAKDFVELGNTNRLTSLLYTKVNPILKESKGNDPEAKGSKIVAKGIDEFVSYIAKNDLAAIIEFSKLKEHLEHYRNEAFSGIKAFVPIVEKIENKIKPFEENSLGNVFAATRWCVEHGMYQNAYSILLEGCISIALNSSGLNWRPVNADQSDKGIVEKYRSIPIAVAGLITGQIKELRGTAAEYPEIINIMRALIPHETATIFEKLNAYRNAYMHCGTGTNRLQAGIFKELNMFINILEQWYFNLKTTL